MTHDFKLFPELRNNQMQFYYFDSPHRQITEDFLAQVNRVIDGDTVELKWNERDFLFPLRMSRIAAPELNESGGEEVKRWLKDRIEGLEVEIKIDQRNRVGKFGRLLGDIISGGDSMSDAMLREGLVKEFGVEEPGVIPSEFEIVMEALENAA